MNYDRQPTRIVGVCKDAMAGYVYIVYLGTLNVRFFIYEQLFETKTIRE